MTFEGQARGRLGHRFFHANTTTGINQIGHSKYITATMVGQPMTCQFSGAGGAALSDSRFDE